MDKQMTAAQDEAFLIQTISELDTIIPLADELVDLWRHGRVEELTAILADGYDEFPDLFAALVSDRNGRWMPALEELLAGTFLEDAPCLRVSSITGEGFEALEQAIADATQVATKTAPKNSSLAGCPSLATSITPDKIAGFTKTM